MFSETLNKLRLFAAHFIWLNKGIKLKLFKKLGFNSTYYYKKRNPNTK